MAASSLRLAFRGWPGVVCRSLLFFPFFFSPAPARAASSLVARQITVASASEDLFSGAEAFGGVGDWYLSNGIVEAVVDNVGFQEDVRDATGRLLPLRTFGYTGGAIIDLGLVGRDNDQLGWVSQVTDHEGKKPIVYFPASLVLGNPALPPVLAHVDELRGVASLAVCGVVYFPAGSPLVGKVLAVTRYSVGRGERVVRILTVLLNLGSVPADVFLIADAVTLFGGLHPFTPSPGGGFVMPSEPLVLPFASLVGSVAPVDGVVDTAAMLPSGEVSYTLAPPESKFLFGEVSPFFLTMGTEPSPFPLAPGAAMSYERRIAVGGRNDVASSADGALARLGPIHQAPVGLVWGRIASTDGMPFRASVVLTLNDLVSNGGPTTLLTAKTGDVRPEPLTHLRVESHTGGNFAALVPAGRYEMKIAAEERPSVPARSFDVAAGLVADVGVIVLPSLGRLAYRVVDSVLPSAGIPAKITFKGIRGTPDPAFGLPIDVRRDSVSLRSFVNQSDPAFNMSYTTTGDGEVFVRPGEYRVYASRGMEYNYDSKDVTIVAGGTSEVQLRLTRSVDTPGYVSADFHVHAARSPDSSVPPVDRVKNFAGEGVEVLVATDHNVLFDYEPILEDLGLRSLMASVVGVEASLTPSSPEDPPFGSRGHWNAWPQRSDAHARRDGAPEEGYVEPAVVFDRLRAGGATVIQLNHPFRGELGYLLINGFDSTVPVGEGVNAFLYRTSILGTGTRNIDFDAIEIYNGVETSLGAYRTARDGWFGLLNQGIRKVATAVTDTHSIVIRHGGFPRTYVASSATDLRALDVDELNESLKSMRALGTSGPFLEVQATNGVESAGLGETLRSSSGGLLLQVKVRAPCWIPVEEVRLFTHGELTHRFPVPYCSSVLRFDSVISLDPAADTYYVVEAGQTWLDDDLDGPPLPGGVMAVLEPTVVSLAFTNPIFVDADGDGSWTPRAPSP